MSETVLDVRDFAHRNSATAGIQEAIDALAKGGGTVFISAGTYKLRRSVKLRSYITLLGEGAATILTRPREKTFKLVRRTIKDKTHCVLERTTGFKEGDELLVWDDTQGGWNARHGIIKDIRKKNTVDLELIECDPERTYSPAKNGCAANLFPALWLPRVNEVTIENLTIDGMIRKHRTSYHNFTCAGIHTRDSLDVRIRNVTVRNWHADGIGVQGGNGMVTGCLAENCRGHGFHPGTSLTHSIWANNVSRFNNKDGFFFCLNVMHAVVQGNLFYRNEWNGIGGLTAPDRFNTVIGNICAENGKHGIEAIKGLGNTIQGNIIRNNSRKEPGRFSGIYLEKHRDNIVTGNIFIDDQKKPTQTKAIECIDPAGENIIKDNHIRKE